MKIFTSFVSPRRFQMFCDNNILPLIIIRSIRNSTLLGDYEGSAIHLPELAPSTELFRARRDKIIDIEEYRKRYATEMSSINLDSILSKIEYLCSLCNTEKAVLLGYGEDDSICHRSVLRDLLGHGITEFVDEWK